MLLEENNVDLLLHQVNSVNSRHILEDFKHYLDQSCARCGTVLLN